MGLSHIEFHTLSSKLVLHPPKMITQSHLDALQADHHCAIQFTYYQQWHLHQQLLSVGGLGGLWL